MGYIGHGRIFFDNDVTHKQKEFCAIELNKLMKSVNNMGLCLEFTCDGEFIVDELVEILNKTSPYIFCGYFNYDQYYPGICNFKFDDQQKIWRVEPAPPSPIYCEFSEEQATLLHKIIDQYNEKEFSESQMDLSEKICSRQQLDELKRIISY